MLASVSVVIINIPSNTIVQTSRKPLLGKRKNFEVLHIEALQLTRKQLAGNKADDWKADVILSALGSIYSFISHYFFGRVIIAFKIGANITK